MKLNLYFGKVNNINVRVDLISVDWHQAVIAIYAKHRVGQIALLEGYTGYKNKNYSVFNIIVSTREYSHAYDAFDKYIKPKLKDLCLIPDPGLELDNPYYIKELYNTLR